MALWTATTLAWAQKSGSQPSSGKQSDPAVSPHHDIPSDGLGNVIRITGRANSKSEASPNGRFEVRFPRRAMRGVQSTSGQIAISGAVVDRRGMDSRRLIKTPVDYVTVNEAGNAVEFSTRTQDGVLILPLIAQKDAQVVVRLYLENTEDAGAFQYFLSPQGLSFQPIKKKDKKK